MLYFKTYLKIFYMTFLAVLMWGAMGSISSAKPVIAAIKQAPWVIIDMGPASSNMYAFNGDTIHYAKNDDSSLNKNIIIYDEMKSNNEMLSTQYQYYTITKAKINLEDNSIFLGDESFYTDKGKFRWTDEPIYPAWVSVSNGSIGNTRIEAIKKYITDHQDKVIKQSMRY